MERQRTVKGKGVKEKKTAQCTVQSIVQSS